jgi:hypothetical protein
MADVDDLESLDTDIRNMTISKIGDVIGSYSIEISDFECLAEPSPLKGVFHGRIGTQQPLRQ